MSIDRGKAFEEQFKENWKKCFPNTFLFRLKDDLSGFKVISANPCDFLAFNNNKLFMLECKSHDGASIPFDAIPQYERLLKYKDLDDVYPGVLVWYKDKDYIYWYPILELEKIHNDGFKSLNPEKLQNNYKIIKIPGEKKRVFIEADYTIFKNFTKE